MLSLGKHTRPVALVNAWFGDAQSVNENMVTDLP